MDFMDLVRQFYSGVKLREAHMSKTDPVMFVLRIKDKLCLMMCCLVKKFIVAGDENLK